MIEDIKAEVLNEMAHEMILAKDESQRLIS